EGMDGKRASRTRIEQMAVHYVSEIRKVQPEGPYHLGGYCFGGLVAFEMAQQLRRQGQNAALVAMFNAPLRFNRPDHRPGPKLLSTRAALRRPNLSRVQQEFRQFTLKKKVAYLFHAPK